MKDQCAISFGQILMKELDGAYLQEELDTHLAKISLNSLTEQMILSLLLEHIS